MKINRHAGAALLLMAASALAARAEDKKKDKAAPAAVSTPAGTLAVVDGVAITEDDLMKQPRYADMRQQVYKFQMQTIDEAIAQRLLEKEAAARKVKVEDLVQSEIQAKVVEPTDADVQAFYDTNKAQIPVSFDEAKSRIKDIVKERRQAERKTAFVAELRAKSSVKVMLVKPEPPRVVVSLDDDPVKGPASAPITIVEFSDYQCPFCSRAEIAVNDVMRRYGNNVRLVFRDFPLPIHPNAPRAAEAASCAGDQGKYWEMHDALFAHQDELDDAGLKKRAAEVGLDAAKLDACLASGKFTEEWKKDAADAQKYGVNSTPAFYINGRLISGARPTEDFEEVINEELQKAGVPVPPKPAPAPAPALAAPRPAPAPVPSPVVQ